MANESVSLKNPRNVVRKIRSIAGVIVNNTHFQTGIVSLILINAIMMGIGTFDAIKKNPSAKEGFEATDQAFLIIFTVELIIQFTHFGLHLFLDGWLVFDFSIVVLSWALSEFQVIRAFRIFRALKLVAKVKVLRDLVSAVGLVLPQIGSIAVLMGLIFYIFSVMFTALFKNIELDENYFGRLDYSFFTCMQFAIFGYWAPVTRSVMAEIWWAWIPIVSFIIISGFIVYSLIIAVVCGAIVVLRGLKEKDDDSDSSKIPTEMEDFTQQVILLQEAHASVQNDLEKLAAALRDNGVLKVADPKKKLNDVPETSLDEEKKVEA